jgi:predicted nucleotidyltransferase
VGASRLRSFGVAFRASLYWKKRGRRINIPCMKRDEVISRLKEAESALRARGAAALYLFGSHARDEARPDSDVDVFIDKDRSRKFGFDEYMDIYLLLQERLGHNVDYGTREGLHPVLKDAIEREALRVF